MGTATVRQVGRGGLLASMALALACGHSPHVDIRQLDSSIRRELPTGTPKSAVVAFLDGHAVHHSESPDKRTVFGLATEVHRWRWSWACGQIDAHFTFQFDEGDRLTNYQIREVPICL